MDPDRYSFNFMERQSHFRKMIKYWTACINQLKPDIVIENDKQIIIADTKWKLLSEDKTHQGISQSDMYQLFAYGTKYKECNDMYLIYPKDSIEDGNSYKYFQDNDNLNLKVLFFDVENDYKKDDFIKLFNII